MKSIKVDNKIIKQILFSIYIIVVLSIFLAFLRPYIDYPIVALVLLFTVSIFAVTLDILPVIFSSFLSALVLNYFFIPPLYTFHIANSNDILLFLIFFVVSIVNAILTNKIRKAQADARDKVEKERAIELYNTILNSLSHELRTPIATITACVDTLSYTPNNLNLEQKSTLLNQIQIASTRLNEQVENLLNMSRLDSGLLHLKANWCDMNEIVLNTINQFADTTKPIHYQENPLFPLVLIDDGLLSQILNNLTGNAIVHTYDKAEINIEVNFRDEKQLTIQIMDTGVGLPDSELAKIFDKFYRVPNSVKGGTGLGLSIVKGYVTALNGTITVKQNIPQGLLFEILIPVEISYINKLKNE